MKRFIPFLISLPFIFGYTTAVYAQASGAAKTERVHSDVDGVDFVASYEPGPLPKDYEAEAESSLPDTDPYVTQRGADKGLIYLKDKNDEAVKRYVIPRGQIRAVVHVRYDMVVLDKADLVFTDRGLILVHTTTTNAGIFTISDIYPLAYKNGKVVDSKHLIKDSSLSKMLALGVSLYRQAVPAAS
ncbi:hypothetical protein [Trinickia dinghuensis]|uniref:Uncharacterized protein n=1 Tax=Trinickia dinghuensis TaxID=2291023 RepID=A0A3D8K259_9BURK|nr:hypothetical protein [Trinickia dinghuensis]RDU98986.1 hypothetical protein DWV00_12165 [Trinickia dinghuensis]